MKVIVCLDDCLGMMFNQRRQSRDRAVISDILKMTDGSRLYIDEYSEKLFADTDGEYTVSGDMLDVADRGDYCFVERQRLSPYVDGIDEIVVYRWNRRYPADLSFDIDVDMHGFSMVHSEDFEGYSHEKITKEIFRK